MTISIQALASGPGWAVSDVVCSAGPGDRAFEERHADACIALVTEGTFQYRTTAGATVLGPGSMLLGDHGQCFECGHDHGRGDRCIAFHFAPECLESIVAEVPGVTRVDFGMPRVPPLPSLMPLAAAAETARENRDRAQLEELSLRLAGAVAAAAAGAETLRRRPGPRDERRISAALRRIETDAEETSENRVSLSALAAEVGMSRYHFLRSFSQVVGQTPHQYVLRTRLHRAAVRLRRTDEPVSAIAFDAGFNDLSTFNRRFRHIMGAAPSAYRAGGQIAGGGRRLKKPSPAAVRRD